MKKYLLIFLIVNFCFGSLLSASSQITKIPLSWKPNYIPHHWLFTKNQQYKGPNKFADLAEIKKLEFNKTYGACAEMTFKSLSKYSDLKHWLILQGLACLNRALETDANWNSPLIKDWFKRLKNNSDFYEEIILREELLFQWHQFLISALKRPKEDQKFKWEIVDYLYPLRDTLSQSLRSDYYKALGDLVNLAGFKDIAKLYLARANGALSSGSNGVVSNGVVSNGGKSNSIPTY
jgi:hypothetical protein